MKKAFDDPDQPKCEVASGLQYGQSWSHDLSEKTAISRSDVSSVPEKGRLSEAT
jgi:hypothetical protein